MDFMSDALFNGRRFRVLAIIDNFTRENLAIEVGQGITGQEVAVVLDEISEVRAKPRTIQRDRGPEFTSKALDLRAYDNGVSLDFSGLGKPADNG